MLGRLQGHFGVGRKILMAPLEIELATFQFVVRFLNKLGHRNGNWIVVHSLLGFGSLGILLEEQIYLVAKRKDIPSQKKPEN
jgi:hypothetical protein